MMLIQKLIQRIFLSFLGTQMVELRQQMDVDAAVPNANTMIAQEYFTTLCYHVAFKVSPGQLKDEWLDVAV